MFRRIVCGETEVGERGLGTWQRTAGEGLVPVAHICAGQHAAADAEHAHFACGHGCEDNRIQVAIEHSLHETGFVDVIGIEKRHELSACHCKAFEHGIDLSLVVRQFDESDAGVSDVLDDGAQGGAVRRIRQIVHDDDLNRDVCLSEGALNGGPHIARVIVVCDDNRDEGAPRLRNAAWNSS